jgi:hypothetical protein
METLVGILALVTFIATIAAHVVLVCALSRQLGRGRGRIVLDAFLPPLAVLDGLTSGARREATLLLASILLHATTVIVARAALG